MLMISLGNDALQTPEDVAALLRSTAAYMEKHGSWPHEIVKDINGNTVGRIVVY
jgi:hypothetical protein